MDGLPFAFPAIKPGEAAPIWKNGKFSLPEEQIGVLEYSSNSQGWNDNLTSFHEENAGENHFIDCCSRKYAISQLDYLSAKEPIILEIGCSSGHLLSELRQLKPQAHLIGADVVSAPLYRLHEKLPDIPLLRFDLLNCPLPNNSIDAVVLLNVLEHIKDDGFAVKQLSRILKPGGLAIIEVPAGPHLYDIYDEELLHFRRYTLSNLSALFKNENFKILKKSHLGFFLYPGFWLVKKRNQRYLNQDLEKKSQIVKNNIQDTGDSKLMKMIMQFEMGLGKFLSYPFGIRCLLTCQKNIF